MSDANVHWIQAEPLTPEGFAPFGQVLAREPDEAVIELRGQEVFHLNILTYEHKPLRCDHLNAHYNATQALFPMGRPTVLVVAPPGTDFDDVAKLDTVRAFIVDQTAGVNLALGTWHWGPYPIGDRVDLVNLQGADFEHDNDIAYLERDLGAVVEVRL
jgi:ureidoglycolate lyase